MAKQLTPTYTDDLSHVAGIDFRMIPTTDEKGDPVLSDGEAMLAVSDNGAPLSASQRVSVSMTQGDTVYLLDTAQGNAIAALIRKVGIKQAKRGRKAVA